MKRSPAPATACSARPASGRAGPELGRRAEVMTGRKPERLASLLDRYGLPAAAERPLGTLLELLATPEAPTSVHDPAAGAATCTSRTRSPGSRCRSCVRRGTIADLGAGAGLPGLVLAAVLPDARVVLVESVGRKCEFLRAAAEAMGLANVEVVWARAEEWSDGTRRAATWSAPARSPRCRCSASTRRRCCARAACSWRGRARSTTTEAGGRRRGRAAPRARRRAGPLRRAVRGLGAAHAARAAQDRAHAAGFPRRPGMATKRPLTANESALRAAPIMHIPAL